MSFGNISAHGWQGDLEQVLGFHRSFSLDYTLKLDLGVIINFIIVRRYCLPNDSKLPCEESFLQDHLLELHIGQGYVHDLQKLTVLFLTIIE